MTFFVDISEIRPVKFSYVSLSSLRAAGRPRKPVLNEHRRAHGCLHVGRRLRDIKNENGFSLAEVATHTGSRSIA